ncbi:unnamed protein product [marine sediment metagenome]|uniref:Uncharacterized protein n=1 Tax=marine sediment metagenome TaxID=412755 RepID=X1TYZ7_9ZZZZ
MSEHFNLQPGDTLVNVNDQDDLFSRIKRWGVGPYSHVFLYLGQLGLFTDRKQTKILRVPMLFESIGRGVCLRLLSERYGEKVVVMRLKSEHDQRRIPWVLQAAIELASYRQAYYDFACIPLHIIPRILHEKLGMPIPLKYQRDERQVCSEAVNEVFIWGRLVDILPSEVVPLPGDFVTDSPLLEEANRGELCSEWLP